MSVVAFRDDRRSVLRAVTAGLLLDAARGGCRCYSGPSFRGFSGPTVTSFWAGQASRAGTPEERELLQWRIRLLSSAAEATLMMMRPSEVQLWRV